MAEYVCELPIDGMVSFVSGTTTIPVRERIVRCRDCKLTAPYGDGIECCGPLVQTWDYFNDQPLHNPVQPDGFCKWGVRRDDG